MEFFRWVINNVEELEELRCGCFIQEETKGFGLGKSLLNKKGKKQWLNFCETTLNGKG